MKFQHQTHSLRLLPVVAAIASAALFAIAPSARASVMTFAQFSETGAGGNEFAYTDSLEAHLGTSGISQPAIPVNFTFLASTLALPADLTGNQDATLQMSSNTSSPVVPGVADTQQITSGTMSFIRNTPAAEGTGTRTRLLTVTFTAELIGIPGSRTPQVSGDTVLGYEVSYTSDFVNLSTTVQRDFSLTFSSWMTAADGNGLELDPATNFFQSATAAATGTFDFTPAAPEPATLTLGLLGTAAFLGRRPRKLTR